MTKVPLSTLWGALLEAQREADAITKTGRNTSQNWQFVTVEEVTRVARNALNSAGLVAVLRVPADSVYAPEHLDCYLHVHHPESGESASFPIAWPVERAGPQARRAAYAYARKQALLELLALAEGDDPETGTPPSERLRARRTRVNPPPQVIAERGGLPSQDDTEDSRPEPPQATLTPSGPLMVTAAQLSHLNAQVSDMERRAGERMTREQRRAVIAEAAGVNPELLQSARDLTRDQASNAIEILRGRLDPTEEGQGT